MLSENSVKGFAAKWQTTEQNVAREYFQHLFLAAFYKLSDSGKIAFKGGTALRILYNSPRFSEDLDFTGALTGFHLQNCLTKTAGALRQEGLDVDITESKTTSGGWFAAFDTTIHSWPVRVELNVSTRTKKDVKSQTMFISPAIVPPYTLISLNENTLVEEKINALLTRKKPRDFFDLYFILRSRLAVGITAKYQHKLLKNLESCNDKAFSNELKIFLPRSYWNIVNNMGSSLKKELERF